MFCDVFSGLAICALKGTKTEIAGKGDFIQVIIAENWWVPSVYICIPKHVTYMQKESFKRILSVLWLLHVWELNLELI